MLGLHILVWSCCLTSFFCNSKEIKPQLLAGPPDFMSARAHLTSTYMSLDKTWKSWGMLMFCIKFVQIQLLKISFAFWELMKTTKKMYNPAKGLYWFRKGKKQLVSLKSPEDLQTCKDEYKGNLHLACHKVSLEKSSGIIAFNHFFLKESNMKLIISNFHRRVHGF